MATMQYSIRSAKQTDLSALNLILPRLADFDVPEIRNPKDLWSGDAKLMEKALTGEADNTFVIVAADPDDVAVGVAMYTIKPELLSGDTSAHLEVLAVHEEHSRQGLGKKLIDATSADATGKGATCMSLHVFSNNARAREVYKATGFDEELIRCFKPLR